MRKIVLLVNLVAALPLFAATHTWSGAASSYMSDPANWIGGPPAGDPLADLDFPSNVANMVVTNDLAMLSARSITFSGGAYALSGNPIGVTSSITDTQGATAAIACDIYVYPALTIYGPSTRLSSVPKLVFSGAISGVGSVKIVGLVSFAGSRPNTYSGATLVSADTDPGMLVLSKPDGVVSVPGDLIIGAVGDRYATVVSTTSEQLNRNAAVTVSGVLRLMPGTTTTRQNLTLRYAGNTVPALNDLGRLNVDYDIFVVGTPPPSSTIELRGEVHIARMQTFAAAAGTFIKFGNLTGSGGIEVRSGSVSAAGTFEGASIASGSHASLSVFNPATPLTVSVGGSGALGNAKSAVVLGAALTMASGGSVAEDLTLDSGSTLTVNVTDPEPAHPYVATAVGGVVALGGATLNILSAHRALGRVYTLIDNRGSAPVVGTFRGIPEGGTTSEGAFRISYHGGDGNDVIATDLRRIPTQTTLRLGPLSAGEQPIRLKASVALRGDDSLDLPTGTVTFTDNGVAIGTVALNGDGADLALTRGRHVCKARYDGDATHEPSVSDPVTANLAYPTPVLTSIAPSTVQAGGMVTLHLTGDELYPALTTGKLAPRRGIVHYISKTEATLELDLTKAAGTLHESIVMANDPSPDSNALSLTITPRPVTITLSDADVAEGSFKVPMQVMARLAAPLPFDVSGDYSTTDGTAFQGHDYVAVKAPFTILAGRTEVALPISILGDDISEPDETFTVSLSGITSVAATTNVATVTIHDDDRALPLLSISDAAVYEGDVGTTARLKFLVTLTHPTGSPVTVDYATSDGTATAPDDYLSAAGTLTFVPGELAKLIEVVVNGDGQFENDEQFQFTLSNATGAVLVRTAAIGTIAADEIRRRAARH